MIKKPVDEFCPKDKEDWRTWLKLNHSKETSVWVIFWKKKSPCPNLSWSEAVDEALCFGWIDSVKKSLDAERYIQFFSKRKAKSTWSKVNKDKVIELREKGLMRSAGEACIDIAKTNGSWTFLDSIDAMIVPPDLRSALDLLENAFPYFEGLSNSSKKGLLYWVAEAKKPETRAKRIQEIAESAQVQTLPKKFF